MDAVLQSAFLKALGWSLVNSLWQMGIVWLLYQLITRNGTKFTAEKRHNLALLSQLTGSLLFLASLIINISFPGQQSFFAGLDLGSGFGATAALLFEQLLPWFSVIYLVITISLLFRLSHHLSSTRTLASKGLTKAKPEIRIFMQQLATQMGIRKPIRVWISSLVETPLTLGFWRPVILLPVAIVNNLSLKQTESIILHELYHIQRNDFLINLLIAVSDIILFFNPFAKYFRNIIQREREHRCDDMVLQFRYDPVLYAQALLILEQHRPARHTVTLAATGTSKFFLLARVKRLVTGETIPVPMSRRLLTFLISTMVLCYLGWNNPGKILTEASVIYPTTALRTTEAKLAEGLETDPGFNIEPAKLNRKDEADENPKEPSAPVVSAPESNVEKDLARVIISEKLGELISSAAGNQVIQYIKTELKPEFTISIDRGQTGNEAAETSFPYVPSSSFQYKITGDTALPKKTSLGELKGKLQLVSALKSINEVNWEEIQQNLAIAGENLDVSRLQLELRKAVAEVDWKTLNNDLEKTASESAAAEIRKYKEELADRYLQYQKSRIDRAKKLRAAEIEVVKDRLKVRKAKKIVEI